MRSTGNVKRKAAVNRGQSSCKAPHSKDSKEFSVRIGADHQKEIVARYYEENRSDLYNYARWLKCDHALAEDFIQQSFANTLDAVSSGTRIENLDAWFRRCILNLFLYNRRQSRGGFLDIDSFGDQAADNDQGVDSRLLLKESLRSVSSLPDHYKQAFVMASLQGYAYEEIATSMNKSVGAVSQLIRRARKQLVNSEPASQKELA